jgi:hypothetical protein
VSLLITNLPPVKVWVRKEYLHDLRKGHDEYVLGYWVSLKSLPGRTFYFETFLPEYGAIYDKLPISAFLIWDPDSPEKPVKPEPDLPLEELQFWNCFSYEITTLEKNLTYTMGWEVRTKTHGTIPGEYLFTIDSFNGDRSRVDMTALMGTALGLISLSQRPQTNTNPSMSSPCKMVSLRHIPTTDAVLLTLVCLPKN